ncbi:MAG: hemerythrin domain-containing protein [Prolixibacteraceae bacterium]|nr:hemerythrin domain-containing protein [Prolixibacteraceae bacterium]
MKHLPFTEKMRMADVIHMDYLLIPIIGRFGIQLGFGNKTVQEICSEKGLEPSFLLDILNVYHNKDYFTESQFDSYPISLIINYLKNTHNYYRDIKIPELEKMVEAFFASSCDENKSNNKLIANFFDSYKQELIKHLFHEENQLFPYTIELTNALNNKSFTIQLIEKIQQNHTAHNDEDHSNLEEKLYDLKNLIIKFLPPVKHTGILEHLLIELFRLETDLNDHSRIEDQVLIPKVIALEQKILEISGQAGNQ